MPQLRQISIFIFIIFCWFSLSCTETVQTAPLPELPAVWLPNQLGILSTKANNLNPHVLKLALDAYINARRQGLDNKGIITIIDYSKPSIQRRLWVINLNDDQILFNTWVTHGKNSGGVNAKFFSNRFDSLKSSLGVFLTEDTYIGENGYSLRIVGLEKGINDNAEKRHIVFHGAWYADPKIIPEYGELGRSWGCPAVNEKQAKPLIDTIKHNTLVFIYYPDIFWLRNSIFLADNNRL